MEEIKAFRRELRYLPRSNPPLLHSIPFHLSSQNALDLKLFPLCWIVTFLSLLNYFYDCTHVRTSTLYLSQYQKKDLVDSTCPFNHCSSIRSSTEYQNTSKFDIPHLLHFRAYHSQSIFFLWRLLLWSHQQSPLCQTINCMQSSYFTVSSFDIGNKFLLLENLYSLAFQNMIFCSSSHLIGYLGSVLDWLPLDFLKSIGHIATEHVCMFLFIFTALHMMWLYFILDFEYQRCSNALKLCIQLRKSWKGPWLSNIHLTAFLTGIWIFQTRSKQNSRIPANRPLSPLSHLSKWYQIYVPSYSDEKASS